MFVKAQQNITSAKAQMDILQQEEIDRRAAEETAKPKNLTIQ